MFSSKILLAVLLAVSPLVASAQTYPINPSGGNWKPPHNEGSMDCASHDSVTSWDFGTFQAPSGPTTITLLAHFTANPGTITIANTYGSFTWTNRLAYDTNGFVVYTAQVTTPSNVAGYSSATTNLSWVNSTDVQDCVIEVAGLNNTSPYIGETDTSFTAATTTLSFSGTPASYPAFAIAIIGTKDNRTQSVCNTYVYDCTYPAGWRGINWTSNQGTVQGGWDSALITSGSATFGLNYTGAGTNPTYGGMVFLATNASWLTPLNYGGFGSGCCR